MANHRKVFANILGALSVVFSPLSLWLLYLVRLLPKHNSLGFDGWGAFWAIGFILSCIAGLLGSRWWFASTLMIALSYFATIVLIIAIFGV
jgi:hypothetical protein